MQLCTSDSWVCRMGITSSTVEVRFEDLVITAKVFVGARALPTVLNSYRNFFEVRLTHSASLLTNMHVQFSSTGTCTAMHHRCRSPVHKQSHMLPPKVSCAQGALQGLKVMKANKRKFTILNGLSGRINPGRMTLLLGPPGAGKSTLLMALAGKLRNSDLNVRCC